jgi:ssDNA-binding replication factor A large subunit
MASATDTFELNCALAEKINQEARANPHSPYAGKYVGLANGQVVVVSESLDEIDKVLRQIEPDSSKTFCVEASRDYSAVEYVWEAH